MSEKKAKILECKFIKEWTGDKGSVFYHDLKLDNGDHGQIGTKDRLPERIAVGQELTYTIEESSYGNKIKAVTEGKQQWAGRKQIDTRHQFIGFSAAYAKDLVVAGKIDIKDMNAGAESIFKNMMKLYESIK